MPTKIINILQDDNFENILRIFQETPANEVIFVLPRKHQALSNDDHFYILSEAASEQGKNVMILTSNSDVSDLALKYNIGVLTSAKANPRVLSQKVKKEAKLQKITTERPEEVEPQEAISEPEVSEELTEDDDSTDMMQSRGMTDIIKPPLEKDKKISVKISKKVERPFEIEVRNEEGETAEENIGTNDNVIRGAIDEIESVWQRRSDESKPPVMGKKNPVSFIKKPRFNIGFLSSLNLSNRALIILGVSVIAVFAIVIFISTGSANIIIKPRAHALDLALSVKTSDKFLAIDLENKTIPGQLFSIEKRVEQIFSATGERDVVQKARGKIIVYNEYGTAPQVLIATTRFESLGGLIFRTLKTITVPGTRVVNGEIIPGAIDVEVIADKAGEFYNIDPGKFTIPAFKEKGDNDRYQKYYAISKEPMKGGIVGKAKVVTDKDYSEAKETVHAKVITDSENELKSQVAELKILSPTAPTIKEVTSTAQVDEAVNEFTVSETVVLQAVGFRESDLYSLIAQYVSEVNTLDVFPDKISIEFSDIKFNDQDKILEFKALTKGSVYSRIIKDKVISDLIGKNEDSIKEYIKEVEGISTARVILSPFWVQKVPTNTDKIKFELQYD